MHRSTRAAEIVRVNDRAGWRGLARGRGPYSWTDWSERRGQDDGAKRDSGADAISRGIEGAGTRSVDGARSTDARSMLHLRCGGAAEVDPGFASAGLRCRSAPALRSSQGGRIFEENGDQKPEQSSGAVEGHGHATASSADHGDRREVAGAG